MVDKFPHPCPGREPDLAAGDLVTLFLFWELRRQRPCMPGTRPVPIPGRVV